MADHVMTAVHIAYIVICNGLYEWHVGYWLRDMLYLRQLFSQQNPNVS